MKFYILIFFKKSARKIQVSLKSDNNNGYLTKIHVFIYDSVCLILSRMRNVSE